MMTVEQLVDVLYKIAEEHEKLITSRYSNKTVKEVQDILEKELDYHDTVSFARAAESMVTIIEVLDKLEVPSHFRNQEFEDRIKRWNELMPQEM